MSDLRVKMAAVESVGGPGNQARDMIPIIVDDAVVHDVVCYVVGQPWDVGKERAVRITTLLNDSGGVGLAPALATRAAPGAVGVGGAEGERKAAALLVGVRAAIAKLHDLITHTGTPLNPFAALDQLEDCLCNAGIVPPARPPDVVKAAAEPYSAPKKDTSGKELLARHFPGPTIGEAGAAHQRLNEQRREDKGQSARAGYNQGDKGRARAGDVPPRV